MDDFRHFLPRIFELTVLPESDTFAEREIVLAKLRHGEWRRWPGVEREAVERFLHAHGAL